MYDISDHFPMFTCKEPVAHTCRQISMTSCYEVRNHSEVNMIKDYQKLGNDSSYVSYDTKNADEASINFINMSQHYILNAVI